MRLLRSEVEDFVGTTNNGQHLKEAQAGAELRRVNRELKRLSRWPNRKRSDTALFRYEVAWRKTADPNAAPEYGGFRRYSVVRSPLTVVPVGEGVGAFGGQPGGCTVARFADGNREVG